MKRKLTYSLILSLLFPMLMGQSSNYIIEKSAFSTKKYAEFSPVYYNGGLVYTTDVDRGLFSYSGSEGQGFFDMYFVDTTVAPRKQKGELFTENLASKFNEGPAAFNAGQDTIYYSRNLMVEGKMSALSSPWNKLGLFSAIKINGEWNNVREFRYNNEWYNITTPCLSPDGKRLYFASDKPDGYGGSDLYYSNWKNGYWDEPVNMGPVINTPGNEAYPYMNPLGDFFFSSDGHPGMGGKDIFYNRYEKNGWREPVALAAPINSEHEDFGIITDTLMKSGYFSSDRDGSIDIFHFHTVFPQVFYKNYQVENNYCYIFMDTGSIEIDPFLTEYVWHFGDGEKISGEESQHCFPGPGSYDLHLDVVDKSTGNVFFNKLQYELQIIEIEQAYITSPDFAVVNERFQLNGLESNLPGYRIVDYSWDFGDSTHAQGATVSHTFNEVGEYDVTLFLTLRSKKNNKSHKAFKSKKIMVVNNQLEKQYLEAEKENEANEYVDVQASENTVLSNIYSAEKDLEQDGVFCLEILSSPDRYNLDNRVFQRLPDKYILKERYDESSKTYSYTVERNLNLMYLYPSFREIRSLGFSDARVRLFLLKDPSEKELFDILERYETSNDKYFDRYERLTTDGYIMLDQIVKFMIKYPQVRLEVGVHTDNTGYSSRNLTLSQRRAETIEDYLENRGVEGNRIVAKGYGEIKPVAPNTYELERRMNRRVEFTILP